MLMYAFIERHYTVGITSLTVKFFLHFKLKPLHYIILVIVECLAYFYGFRFW